MMKDYLKKLWPYFAIFAGFTIMACVYMSPELNGEKIGASDNIQAISAMGEELTYTAQTGKQSWWNGAMFCGMPNYQIGGADYESTKWLSPLMKIFRAGYGSPIALLLIYLVCFYTLMLSMKMGRWLSVIGAIALTFSSYFIVIIGTSHVTKATSIALMTLALAGFYLIYHNYRKTGVCLCMVGTAVGFAPHPQMTYYICFLFAAFGCAELWMAYKSKAWKTFSINCVLALAALGVGVGTSVANTFANMEYVKESIRGGVSELKKSDPTDQISSKHSSNGLDYKYATEYSYGIGETMTFLIPDYMGGSSTYNLQQKDGDGRYNGGLDLAMGAAADFYNQAPLYWGSQSFTSGPVYLGSVIILLFVLGLFIVKGPYKWALLAVTILSVCLSWGCNFESFNGLFFDYFPLFNKFRAVSSILVVAEIAVPLLAIMALKTLLAEVKAVELPVDNQKSIKNFHLTAQGKQLMKCLFRSTGIILGICVLAAIFAMLFAEFHSDTESLIDANGAVDQFMSTIVKLRKQLLFSDVLRSIRFIAAAALLLIAYIYGKLKKGVFVAILGALILFDMWSVDKRYVNDSVFCPPGDYSAAFEIQPWERYILDTDSTPSFRVVNISSTEQYPARTSYRLKSILGYSAAKLRRYDDIINVHIKQMHEPVFNMLNTKYWITDDSIMGQKLVRENTDAMGNAWFVDTLRLANTPQAESDGLMKYDLHRNAIVGKDFVSHVKDMTPGADSLASVKMTKYEPDAVYYDATCSKPGTIVFSEIYYPYGWKAYVDDKPVDHYRVNYVLRALNIQPGDHKIRFEFRPDSVEKGNTISMIFVILMYITLAACPIWWVAEQAIAYRKRRNESE